MSATTADRATSTFLNSPVVNSPVLAGPFLNSPNRAGSGRMAASQLAAPARMHLTARGRRVVAILGSAALLITMNAVNALQASAHDTTPATRVVVVAPGQTLWGLAQSVAPGRDPRETVFTIEQLNGLTDSSISDGQRLVVPVVK